MTDFKRWALAALIITAGLVRAQQTDGTAPDTAQRAEAAQVSTAAATETPSVREMIGRIKGLWSTTGIAGFLLKEDPAAAADPAHAAARKKIVLPFGVGQFAMIFVCLILLFAHPFAKMITG